MPSAADGFGTLFAAGVIVVFLFIFFRLLGSPRSRRRPPSPVSRRTDTSREFGGGWQGAGIAGADATRPRHRGSDGPDGGGGSASDSGGDGGGGDGGGGGGD